jgi:hypothetical protein
MIIPHRSLILMRDPKLAIDNVIVDNPYDLMLLNHIASTEVPPTVAIHHKDGCEAIEEPHLHPSENLGIFIYDDNLKISINLRHEVKDIDVSFSCDLALYEFHPGYADREDETT